MDVRGAYERLDMPPEEQRLLWSYEGNLLRRDVRARCAVESALHALDYCDKQIGTVLERKPKTVNQSLHRTHTRLGVRGKGSLVRLIQTRPSVLRLHRPRVSIEDRPFARNGDGLITDCGDYTVD